VTVAEGQVASAEADLSERQRQLSKTHNALRLLTGSDFVHNKAISDRFSDSALPPQIPAGLPSDLLSLRPDILQAEQNLIAANADIGSARAAFFPRISLTTSVGYSSLAEQSVWWQSTCMVIRTANDTTNLSTWTSAFGIKAGRDTKIISHCRL
jgi:outer membrane protein TolC